MRYKILNSSKVIIRKRRIALNNSHITNKKLKVFIDEINIGI